MNRFVIAGLVAFGVGFFPQSLFAQSQPSGVPGVKACSLMSKEEVRQLLPWHDLLDGMPIEEEAVGVSGSSCNYPSVFIQVLPFSQHTIEAFRDTDGVESVGDMGDEAYFRNNRDEYAEVVVKAGDHLLTVQANVDSTVEAVKPNALMLAKALAEQLR